MKSGQNLLSGFCTFDWFDYIRGMKIYLILLPLLISSTAMLGQKKPVKNEIDNLCEKWKDGHTYVIVNSIGSFSVVASIEYNDGLPCRITLSGTVKPQLKSAVNGFITDLSTQKETKGYVEDVYNSVYHKGSLYFKFTTSGGAILDSDYSFSIENGDTKRIAGKKADKVEF